MPDIYWDQSGSVDPSGIKWESPLPQPTAAPAIKWDAAPVKTKTVPAQSVTWGAPTGKRPPKWLYSVGPNDVMGDYNQTWASFGKGGIKPQFKRFVDTLGDAGFSMGVYDFDRGHHYAPNDPHLEGRAVDVDTINGEGVGDKLTPKIGQFISTALAASPDAWVGVPKQIYNALPKALQSRAFIDAPAHIHVELSRAGVAGDVHAPAGPEQHLSVQQMEHTAYAGLQLPLNERMARAWSQKNAELQSRIAHLTSIVQRVPIKEFLAVLGAPQRAVGMAAYGMEHGADAHQMAKDEWDGLTNLDTTRNATDAVESALRAAHVPGMLTRSEMQSWVNEHDVPAPLKPYLAAVYGAVEDFSAQTLSDPLTYAGGLGIWAKGMKYAGMGLGAAARGLASIDDAIGGAAAAGRLGSLLKQPGEYMLHASAVQRRMAGNVGSRIQDEFAIRPDLQDFTKGKPPRGSQSQAGGFTSQGVQRRIAVENSELKIKNDETAADQAALRHLSKPNQAIAARYLRLVYQHGTQDDSDYAARQLGLERTTPTGWLAGIKGLSGARNVTRDMLTIGKPDAAYTADDALGALLQGRNRVRQYGTAQRTAKMVEQFPDSVKPGSSPQTEEDWRGVAMDPKRASRDNNLFDVMRELQRANVMVFPFAHGIGNVGQLSYLGAPDREGLRVVVNGFRYMLGRATGGKLPGSLVPDEAELTKYGAGQTYVHEHEAPGLWNHMGDVLGGEQMKSWVIKMQTMLGHMETGWRAALWDALKHNPETAKLDPLVRGAMVAQRAGDPRNVAAFVRSFEQLGGPFVAYRLGIVPRAVLDAIVRNPQRVLAAIRPVLDLQDNRSREAQQRNTLMVNDPVENAARLFGPGFFSYLLSPSTIGLFGFAEQLAGGYVRGEPWEQAAWNTLNSLNPMETPMKIAGWLLPHLPDSQFNPMPGQKMSLVDHLMGSLMTPLASFYLAKAANQKYEMQQIKRVQKAVEKWDKDFLDLLTGKGT